MLFSADFYPTQEEAIAQLGQYLQSPEEDDVDESGILQVLHKVELKETDSEYLQARTANIMEKILEIEEKLNQAAAGPSCAWPCMRCSTTTPFLKRYPSTRQWSWLKSLAEMIHRPL